MAGLQGSEIAAALSHDLMASLLVAGDLTLERVIIHAIEDDTFRAVLKLSRDDAPRDEEATALDEVDVDARPSDAIALAVRTGSGIWMLEEVVAEASIAVDAEADARDQSDFNRFVDELSPQRWSATSGAVMPIRVVRRRRQRRVRRAFGRGRAISLFSLGTMRALGSVDQMAEVLEAAVQAGINHLETAPACGPAGAFPGPGPAKQPASTHR